LIKCLGSNPGAAGQLPAANIPGGSLSSTPVTHGLLPRNHSTPAWRIFSRARESVGPMLFSGMPTAELISW